MKIKIINGPNLNMLGIREPEIYGNNNYDCLKKLIADKAKEMGIDVEIYQSNHEGAIVDEIQNSFYDGTNGIVINPAAYTHTSVAIADALKAVGLSTVEVHISDVSKRESFRQVSYVRDVAVKTIMGKGFDGYVEAMGVLKNILSGTNESNDK